VRRVLAVGLIAGLWIVLTGTVAGAHALVRSSDPAANALLQKPPAQVLITFTEPPDPGLSIIHVLDSTGRTVEAAKAERVPGQPVQLRVPLKAIGNGVYTVTWRTVSKVDGHVTGGSFSFGVGVSPVGAAKSTVVAPTTPSPSPLAAAGRWALYVGLAVLAGAVAVEFLVFRSDLTNGRPVLLSAWALSALGLVAMIVAERHSVGVPLGRLLSSSAGGGLVRQGIGLAVAGIAVGFASVRPGRTSVLLVGAAAAAAMLLHAEAGHAGAAASFRWFNVGVQWVHLLAVAVWIGGLLWLLFGIRGRETPERAQDVRRFSWLAGIALAVVAVTGLFRALDEVGGPRAWRNLFDTSFGITLLVKVGLFIGLVALGARNRYVNVPGIAHGTRRLTSLRRTVGAELLIAAGVFGATGVLTQLPPAASVASAARPTVPRQVVVIGNDFATSVRVRLTVSPGVVGANAFAAVVTDYDTGRPVDASRVGLTFSLTGRPELGSPSIELTKGARGTWTGQGTVISMEGRWSVSVLVQEPSSSVEVPLDFNPRLPPERIEVSSAPGQPTVYTIALGGGASLQGYVDPGGAGNNTVHFTFFRASGEEQPIASATAIILGPSGSPEDLPLVRFDPGHFIANTSLSPGHWRFHIRATTGNGAAYDAYFEQHVPG
jgi:copper transport protein